MASNKKKALEETHTATEVYYSRNYHSAQTSVRKTKTTKKNVGSKQQHWMIHSKKKHRRGQNRLTGKNGKMRVAS